MNHLDVWIDDQSLGGSALVGHLDKATSKTGDAFSFEYAGHWVDGNGPVPGFPLDSQLPLGSGRHYARTGANTLTGALIDCSPDRWGKRLMDRREAIEAREQGRRPRNLRDWDYLIGVHDESRMGALRLLDPESARYVDDRELSAPPLADLRELEAIAAQVEGSEADESEQAARWIKQLIAPGASLGGARPKASFRDPDGSLWLAKFPSNEDRHDVGLWEYLVHRLSLAAGINMPEAKLLKLSKRGHTYAVRRFDRTPTSRRAFASAMTLLDATVSEGYGYLDLVHVVEATGASGRIAGDLEQLFRRVLFNVLVGNRDDHLRNHGFLRAGDGWQLSPAFDVNPNPDTDHHVLKINADDASADSQLLIETADFYRLKKTAVEGIANQIREVVGGWRAMARQMGIGSGEIAIMSGVIDEAR